MAADDPTAGDSIHPSDSGDQILAEAAILDLLGKSLGVTHVGKLRGGQRHKVSTDALKLLAIREAHPDARLILAFADAEAARSVSGWKAQTLKANGIEVRVVDLDQAERERIEAAQARQRMINPRRARSGRVRT